MDISISRLNNRMALQVPAELPLGLVFVVGQVTRLQRSRDGKVVFFELVQGRHRLPCRLPGRVAQETLLQEGDRVRAGGRLLFNPRLAGYLLVTRDVEVLPRRATDPSLQSIIEDARSRKSQTQKMRPQAASAMQSDLPAWVARLAPPQVRRELDLQADSEREAEDGPDLDEPSSEVDAVADMETETPADSALSPEMVTFLSQAIDSNEEIELTSEMLSSYLPHAADSDPASRPVPQDEERPASESLTPADDVPPNSADDGPTDSERAAVQQSTAAWRARLPTLALLLLVLLLVAAALMLILTQA